jgi:hypothetical protein
MAGAETTSTSASIAAISINFFTFYLLLFCSPGGTAYA